MILVCLALWLGLPLAAEPIRSEAAIPAMGATFSVMASGPDRGKLEAAIRQALAEAQRLDRLLSNYLPGSEWSQVNRRAAHEQVRVSPELFALLEACVRYSRESEGSFDITVGPLMKAWGFYQGSGHLPPPDTVRETMKVVGYRHLILDPRAGTVHFDAEGVELDPGGIGKGYAVDRMAAILKRAGVQSALINAGGSSLYAIGNWPVELSGLTLLLQDESVSTSGTAEKFFIADGQRYSHIMDPRSGFPAQGMLQVSVISPRCIDSEAWAKPYFILGEHWARLHKANRFKVYLCPDQPNARCRWVD
jgi:FAD:protein FMN transferase